MGRVRLRRRVGTVEHVPLQRDVDGRDFALGRFWNGDVDAVPLACVRSTSVLSAPDNSSLSHFSAMTRPSWLGRAVGNRHRHAIEQIS